MMTASELFEAAKEELGDRRVDKLKKINEEAAARIAAFEAARRAGQATNLSDIPAAYRRRQLRNRLVNNLVVATVNRLVVRTMKM